MGVRDPPLSQQHECNISPSFASPAAAETTTVMVKSFFLAMVQYPEVQRKAQAEIDAVIGPDRLPTYEDKASLPYVEALVREVHRWNPAVPGGKWMVSTIRTT